MIYLTPWQDYKTYNVRRVLNGEKIVGAAYGFVWIPGQYSFSIDADPQYTSYTTLSDAMNACDELLVRELGYTLLSDEQFMKIGVLV